MSDIELVIKLNADVVQGIIDGENNVPRDIVQAFQDTIADAIKNGVLLPKGHGDLIDINDIRVIELEDSLHIIRHEKGDETDVYIDALPIIEADTED